MGRRLRRRRPLRQLRRRLRLRRREVEVSIRQGTGDYWDGSGFTSASEIWNDATLAAGDWAYDFDSSDFPADGDFTVRARARDDAGNTETASSRTFELDATAPASTTSFPGAAGTYNVAGWDAGCTAAGLCGTYSDGTSGVAEVELSIRQGTGDYWDGSGFTSASEIWNDATLAAGDWSYDFDAADFPADGSYTVRVRARDVAGNTEGASSRTFTFDSTEPETTIDSTMADPTSSTSASFDFSSNEPGSTFECAIDGGAWGACTSPTGYTGLLDGGHSFEVRATDVAGNTDGGPASFSWTIDTVAPSSTATFPTASASYTAAAWAAGCSTAGLCGTYSDSSGSGVVDVEVSIRRGSGNYWDGSGFTSASEIWNDATLAAGDWSYDFDSSDFPADGSYTVRLRAVDDAGNTESASSRTFTIDRAAPQTTIDSNPADPTASTDADFDFSSSEPGSTFECRIDGGAWGACTSPKSYTSLADGSHTFHVRATDAAGNTDGSAASSTWLVDTTAPSSTTTFPAASGEYNATGWDAGCATAGLCGSYGDGSGSGVASVQVSIRQGSGNYWDGSGFTSASEVWNDATLAAGDWSYDFDSSNFPADGDLHGAGARARCRRQHGDPGKPHVRLRRDRPERLPDRAGRRRSAPRQLRDRLLGLGRYRLGREHRRVPAPARGRRRLDDDRHRLERSLLRELGHDLAGRRRLRPARRHDRRGREHVHVGDAHGHGGQHAPERGDARHPSEPRSGTARS